MRLFRRPLAPGETDWELLWLSVPTGATPLIFYWLEFSIPLPRCPVAMWLHLPCPTCGGTRLFQYLRETKLSAAFFANPLLLIVICGVALWCVYAAVVVSFRLRRVRFSKFSEKFRNIIRGCALFLFVANWTYLYFFLPLSDDKTGADFHGGSAMHRYIIDAERR